MRYRAASILLVLFGCSPTIRVEASFELPSGKLDPARLHMRGRYSCPAYNEPDKTMPTPPPPGLREAREEDYIVDGGELIVRPRTEVRSIDFDREGPIARTQIHGSHCWLALTAFYDTNGDGVVGAGDYVATVPATEVVDRGICMGNMNRIGPVKLAPR